MTPEDAVSLLAKVNALIRAERVQCRASMLGQDESAANREIHTAGRRLVHLVESLTEVEEMSEP